MPSLAGLTWKPFTITVQGVGFFPGTRSPRVFWAGMEAPTMQGLAEQLDSRMERLGFEKEKRAFRPHITLARAQRYTHGFSAGFGRVASMPNTTSAPSLQTVSSCSEHLKPAGAVYDKVKEYHWNHDDLHPDHNESPNCNHWRRRLGHGAGDHDGSSR